MKTNTFFRPFRPPF